MNFYVLLSYRMKIKRNQYLIILALLVIVLLLSLWFNQNLETFAKKSNQNVISAKKAKQAAQAAKKKASNKEPNKSSENVKRIEPSASPSYITTSGGVKQVALSSTTAGTMNTTMGSMITTSGANKLVQSAMDAQSNKKSKKYVAVDMYP